MVVELEAQDEDLVLVTDERDLLGLHEEGKAAWMAGWIKRADMVMLVVSPAYGAKANAEDPVPGQNGAGVRYEVKCVGRRVRKGDHPSVLAVLATEDARSEHIPVAVRGADGVTPRWYTPEGKQQAIDFICGRLRRVQDQVPPKTII